MIKNISDSSSGYGIISYFFYNDTINYQTKVTATPSSTHWGPANNLLNPIIEKSIAGNNWCSSNVVNSSFLINFPENKVKLHSYTIWQNCHYSNHRFHSWIVEGSEDGIEWKIIDSKVMFTDSSFFAQCGFVNTKTEHIFYRSIRFIMTGLNSDGYNHFIVSRVEIFGELWSLENANIYICSPYVFFLSNTICIYYFLMLIS